MDLFFDEFVLDQVFEIPPAVVDEEEMMDFHRKYDMRTFHLDEEAAARTPFKRIFASGFFTLCFAWGQWIKISGDDMAIVAGV